MAKSVETETLPFWYKVHVGDTVVVALADIPAGVSLSPHADGVCLVNIPAGHKVAVKSVAKGSAVFKYGSVIGTASEDISVGDHVHSHNLESALSADFDGMIGGQCALSSDVKNAKTLSYNFMGYKRDNGRVGTRNEIWVLPTVGCVNSVAEQAVKLASRKYEGEIDGIYAFPHPFGCSQLGDDLSGTRQILRGLAENPNAGGVLILGLGCENNQLKALVDGLDVSPERLKTLAVQEAGDEIAEAVAFLDELMTTVRADKRTECSLSDIAIGLKCGGSDAFSGLTANPLLGWTTDLVTNAGGTALLTEIPEIFGAESGLLARSTTQEVRNRLIAEFKGFRAYFESHGEAVYENPSPGNKAGGITTLEEKSLGAVQKAGGAPVVDVLAYGEPLERKGLNVVVAPGNDAVSATALAAAGATLILFTTGRGTPLGFPVPTVKIASNSTLAERKTHWIDYNAGHFVAEGGISTEAVEGFIAYLMDVASGTPTRNELNGAREIAIWKRGVTL